MKQPTPEQLEPLLKAVDTAVWAWSVKCPGRSRIKIDWKSALDELGAAWYQFQLVTSDFEAVLSEKENK